MTRKAILFISPQPFFLWRGSPIRVKFNLLALVEAGYEVDLLTFPIGEDIPLKGVTVHRVANPFRVKQVPIGPSAWKLFFDVLLLWKGWRLCRRKPYTIIHGVEEAGLLAALLARWFEAGAVFEKHSDPFSYRAGFLKNLVLRLYAACERLTARCADVVIGTGPGLVEQVTAMGTGTPAVNIPDIPSSVCDPDEQEVVALRQQWKVSSDQVLITYVGSFAIYQGIDLLFAAIPGIVRCAPVARILIIGGTPAEIEARRRDLASQGVADAVIFAGCIEPDRLPAYLSAADILLSTRLSGVNTPLKVLDYLKAGRAILATDVTANRLLLDESLAAFVVPQPDALAEAVAALAQQPEQRNQLGAAGRALYESRYTLSHHQERLRACYAEVERALRDREQEE